MATQLSPGAQIQEIDVSLYAARAATTVLGTVGVFTKGPMDTPTLVTNENQLLETFGRPSLNALGFLYSREFLREGNQLWVVRVGTSSIAKGEAIFNDLLVGGVPSIKFTALTNGTHSNFVRIELKTDTTGVRVEVYEEFGNTSRLREVYQKITRANAVSEINGRSQLVTVEVLVGGGPGEPAAGAVKYMTGGDDGLTGAAGELNNAVVGNAALRSGLKGFENPEAVDITILTAPGFTSGSVLSELIRIAETRHDCIAILDTPDNITPAQSVDFHNGTGAYTVEPGIAFNSSFAAMYYSWHKVNDEYNGVEVYIPPSAVSAALYARTDRLVNPYHAPAGYRRGIANTLGVRTSPTQGERDLMMSGGNTINPYVNVVKTGIVLMGQQTLQRFASALDRVDVRRTVLIIEKIILTVSRTFLFQKNDRGTWAEWVGIIEPVLAQVVQERGLTDFKVIMDETTNDALTRARKEMKGKVFVKPNESAEKIEIDFYVTSQAATFGESITNAA